MKKVLAFAGSNGSRSINQKLVVCAVKILKKVKATVIELRDYPAPVFSPDIERNEGVPHSMVELHNLFTDSDGFIIALPEYNNSLTPVFKNTIDWISRIERPIFQNKPLLLMSTSPGSRGGRTNLEHVLTLMPHWGGHVVATYSLPSFRENINTNTMTFKDTTAEKKLSGAMSEFENGLQ